MVTFKSNQVSLSLHEGPARAIIRLQSEQAPEAMWPLAFCNYYSPGTARPPEDARYD